MPDSVREVVFDYVVEIEYTVYGGHRMDIKKFWDLVFRQYKCYVTFVLVAANIIIFIGMFFKQQEFDALFVYNYGGMMPESLEKGEWIRLLTACFIHFDLIHLGNNMLMLAVIGGTTERYMGSIPFALVYLLGGVAGNCVSAFGYLQAGRRVVAAGASGAIFAVVGALLCVVIANRGKLENFTTRKMILFIVLIMYQGLSSENVDNYAHGGGLVAGILIGAVCCLVKYMRNYGKEQSSYEN